MMHQHHGGDADYDVQPDQLHCAKLHLADDCFEVSFLPTKPFEYCFVNFHHQISHSYWYYIPSYYHHFPMEVLLHVDDVARDCVDDDYC